MSRENWVKYLDEFVQIVENKKVSYFLDHGTLLGAARNNEIIPWDNDIDLGTIWLENSASVIKEILQDLNTSGWQAVYWNDTVFAVISDCEVSLKFYNASGDNYKGSFVDMSCGLYSAVYAMFHVPAIYMSDTKNRLKFVMLYLGYLNPLRKRMRRKLVKDLLIPAAYFDTSFVKIALYSKRYMAPGKFKDYLGFKYGDNWLTPRKDYNYLKDDGAIEAE